MVVLYQQSTTQENHQSELLNINSQLRDVEARIEQRVKRDQTLKLKFSRLFESSHPNQSGETSAEKVSIVPSINIPHKDNFYYSMMVVKNGDYFTLRGERIVAGRGKDLLVSSARNEYTYFGEFSEEEGIFAIKKLKVVSRQLELEPEKKINSSGLHLNVSNFFVFSPSGQQHYVLVDAGKGKIVFFDRAGQYLREVKAGGKILQIDKFSNMLIVLTATKLFYLTLTRQPNKTSCVLPYSSLDYFLFEDSNFRFMYGVKNGYIYQYDLGGHCRPVRTYHVPVNSTLFLTSQMVIIESKGSHFGLNLTDSSLRPFTMPIDSCAGSSKESILRKISSQYMIARICVTSEKVQISYVMLDF